TQIKQSKIGQNVKAKQEEGTKTKDEKTKRKQGSAKKEQNKGKENKQEDETDKQKAYDKEVTKEEKV
ncbi:hypothetical protein, partial [Staphylococcus aureus]|uniref:hypothetical protein n=1 Tax=Staphylococcus aureus TaxID=1280 RepID=UPI001C9E9324